MKVAALVLVVCAATIADGEWQATSSRISDRESVIPHHGRCEPIIIPLCKDIKYNQTIMPNLLNHQKQEDAGMEVHQFFPLVKVQCSPDLQFFLCSMYAPVCTILERAIPPCRSLCQSARDGCEALVNKFGFRWPEALECSKFPEGGGGGDDELCVGRNSNHGASNTVDSVQKSSSSTATKIKNTNFSTGRDYLFACPLQFQTLPGSDYVLRINGKEEKNCGAPCEGVLFNKEERKNLRIWTGTWAILCIVSTLFTVLTFLVDTRRFKYPERPIIFLSVCYFFVAVVYVVGFAQGDKIACNDPAPPPRNRPNLPMVSLVTQGNKKENCTLLFMTLYFFTMSSAIWWVILTLTWVLAAGLKWSPEAIENNSHYFHLVAWALPAIKTITVLAMGKVEGDPLSGVCFVGIWNQETLNYFVFLPLLIYLVFGFILLLIGFISMFKIRTLMKMDGTKTDKLEKLMLRIGFFSALYMCPGIILLSCYYYEKVNFDSWIMAWLNDICTKREYSVGCPPLTADKLYKPSFAVFLLKYLATLMAGITSGFWIWSEKTFLSWVKFYGRLCCPKTKNEAYI
ncbi:Frizzled-7-A-like protein [Dinothrombium tinctorium]|uniref:Frizzled-7-A-like protein n=1 Tax=Dinothrombium tinctorium TaxID=1965070 RepID=A0A3S3S161_9ACAR|nr:Frizzled-7-A-like protein [Dinothrombium tinctorium]